MRAAGMEVPNSNTYELLYSKCVVMRSSSCGASACGHCRARASLNDDSGAAADPRESVSGGVAALMIAAIAIVGLQQSE
jgi:hypothetical protein